MRVVYTVAVLCATPHTQTEKDIVSLHGVAMNGNEWSLSAMFNAVCPVALAGHK